VTDEPMRPLRHGYTHDTRGDGSTVLKRYQGPLAEERRSTEKLLLSRLPGTVPHPPLIDDPVGALRMRHVPGVHGQDLLQRGRAAAVLRACGTTLRTIQAIDSTTIFTGATGTLVHGDYGPNNMLLDPVMFATTAVLDWEWAHAGDPVEDLAWCEWIVRMHHADAVPELKNLFDGYGDRPSWRSRRSSMLTRCRELIALFDPDTAGAERWRQNTEITASWTEPGNHR